MKSSAAKILVIPRTFQYGGELVSYVSRQNFNPFAEWVNSMDKMVSAVEIGKRKTRKCELFCKFYER
jgi:hypothetical protein